MGIIEEDDSDEEERQRGRPQSIGKRKAKWEWAKKKNGIEKEPNTTKKMCIAKERMPFL